MKNVGKMLNSALYSLLAIGASDMAFAQYCSSYAPAPGWTGQGPSGLHWTVDYNSNYIYSHEALYGESPVESCDKYVEFKEGWVWPNYPDGRDIVIDKRLEMKQNEYGQCYAVCRIKYLQTGSRGTFGPYDGFSIFYRAGAECPYGKSWSPTLNTCVEPPDDCESNPVGGNPVVISTGRKKQVFEDYRNGPISVNRIYRQNSIGGRWSFSFDTRVNGLGHSLSDAELVSKISLHENGVSTVLIKSDSSCWKTSSGKCYSVGFTGSTVILQDENKTLTFDNGGFLVSSKNNDSSPAVSYSYSPNRDVITISHNSKAITVSKLNGKVASISDADVAISYVYDTSGMLEKVIWPDGTEDYYLYSQASNTLLSEAGTDGVPFAYWSYDESGRVNKSWRNGNKETTEFAYSDSFVTVRNSLGKETAYHYDVISGVRKLVRVDGLASQNCAPSSQYIGYSADGEVTTRTDRAGNVSLLERDAFGRITKTTDGLKWSSSPLYGLGVDTSALQPTDSTTIKRTCWHPTLGKPTRIIEPSRVINFNYLSHGQLESKVVEKRTTGNEICP